MLPELAGGIGFFLLGMLLMTDGLKALAGHRLRQVLARFTRRPTAAFATGAIATAAVQSSSATTLTTIGLVSAGIVGFEASLGVIIGANVGTTATGWIVSLIGLKFSMTAIALPVVGIGALVRLLGNERWANAGMALAGFGLIFVGIDLLQLGLAGSASLPAARPGFVGAALLVLAGILITFVLQSSSAALAATLAAVAAGTLDLRSGALLVVGQNIGTTITAVLGSFGAAVPAKRTAAAHVIFNLGTGLVAIALLPLFLRLATMVGDGDQAVALAAFHTGFNLVGAAIFLPAVRPYARVVRRLVPERAGLARNVDAIVTTIATAGAEAIRKGQKEVMAALVAILRTRARGKPTRLRDWGPIDEALARLQVVLERLPSGPTTSLTSNDLASLLAAQAALSSARRQATLLDRPADDDFGQEVEAWLKEAAAWAGAAEAPVPGKARIHDAHRQRVIQQVTEGTLDAIEATDRLLDASAWTDALRDLRRCAEALTQST